jgi:hypothetical protein
MDPKPVSDQLALPFSAFCRTIASRTSVPSSTLVPAAEAANRWTGGEHPNVGGEPQALRHHRPG